MKTYFVLILIFFVFLVSCIEEPSALFSIVDGSEFWTYENIQFNNASIGAETFSWDFGNGKSVNDNFPVFFYELPGEYTITLTAYSKKEKYQDSYSLNIYITQPTDLSIKIYRLNPDTQEVDSAKVTLYKTFEDWTDYKNKFKSLISDDNGLVFFRDLEPIVYYVDIFKHDETTGFWTNWNSGYKTDTLKENSINYYPVILEYFNSE